MRNSGPKPSLPRAEETQKYVQILSYTPFLNDSSRLKALKKMRNRAHL